MNEFLRRSDVLFSGDDIRFGGFGCRLLHIAVLTRHRAAGGEHLVSLPGDIGQIACGDKLLQGGFRLAELPFRLRNGGLGLGHLLVEIRLVDLGE